MKFIKTYETYKLNYKKYIIFYLDHNNTLNILRILSNKNITKSINENGWFITKHLYEYTLNNNEIIKQNGGNFAILDNSLNNILYQSDNLKDCIKQLPILAISNKYNL